MIKVTSAIKFAFLVIYLSGLCMQGKLKPEDPKNATISKKKEEKTLKQKKNGFSRNQIFEIPRGVENALLNFFKKSYERLKIRSISNDELNTIQIKHFFGTYFLYQHKVKMSNYLDGFKKYDIFSVFDCPFKGSGNSQVRASTHDCDYISSFKTKSTRYKEKPLISISPQRKHDGVTCQAVTIDSDDAFLFCLATANREEDRPVLVHTISSIPKGKLTFSKMYQSFKKDKLVFLSKSFETIQENQQMIRLFSEEIDFPSHSMVAKNNETGCLNDYIREKFSGPNAFSNEIKMTTKGFVVELTGIAYRNISETKDIIALILVGQNDDQKKGLPIQKVLELNKIEILKEENGKTRNVISNLKQLPYPKKKQAIASCRI